MGRLQTQQSISEDWTKYKMIKANKHMKNGQLIHSYGLSDHMHLCQLAW